MKFALFAAVLVLPACGYVVPSTVARLASVTLLTADPGQYAVTITLPDGFGIVPGTAKLLMDGQRSDTGETMKQAVRLRETQKADQTVTYDIPASEQEQLRDMQATMRQWKKEAGRKASGSMGFSLDPCKTRADADLSGRLSVSVSLAPGQPPVPLLNDVPARKVLAEAQLDKFPMCEG